MKNQEELDFEALEETGFYGRMGSGILFYCTSTKRYLLMHRSRIVEQPGTWGILGGACPPDEKPMESAKREAYEEARYTVTTPLKLLYIFKSGTFSYFTYLVKVKNEFEPVLNWESQNYQWASRDNFPEPLHFGVQELIKHKKI